MPQASTLRELLRIRQRNADQLRTISGYLGSAVGYKYHEDTGEFAVDRAGRMIPAILVFVRRKLPLEKIPPKDRVRSRLTGPDRLTCATDVVVGALPSRPPRSKPFSTANRKLLKELHEKKKDMVGGLPIAAPHAIGTAACVVKRGKVNGFLTNWHVAGFPGTRILRPSPRLGLVGHTMLSELFAKKTKHKDDLESYFDHDDTRHRLDAAFIAFGRHVRKKDRDPGVHGLGKLGKPYQLDLDTMGPIGERVAGVGQTLGMQRGIVAAYGYEWRTDPEDDRFYATDYLILGEGGQPFAAPGDSGKLVVTDDDRRPLALLWGGQKQEFWSAEAQESWAYASRIDTVLKQLKLKIVS